VVAVTAPAGYGKTTLLSQWAEAEDRPVVWLTLDERDNDPTVLLTYLAVGVDRIQPIDPKVLRALGSPPVTVLTTVVPRLAATLRALERPAVLVLDDLHELADPVCLDAIFMLADALPEGSQLAFGSRSAPPQGLARVRAEGGLLEIGPSDLALDDTEAASLLRAAGVDLADSRVREIVRRTEGWAAGLYLAALSLRSDPHGLAERFSGEDRFVVDYLRSEVFTTLPARDLRFLARTSVLDLMCGPLCDAVTDGRGSSRLLERLEVENLFLVPMDRHREWYRYHHLFRDALLAELEGREPGRAPELRRRAAAWHEARGQLEIAVEYLLAAGDADGAAALATTLAVEMYRAGRLATLQRWIERFDAVGAVERHAPLTISAAFTCALTGDVAAAVRWTDIAERSTYAGPMPDGSPSFTTWLASLRALRCAHGVAQMRADAELALRELPRSSVWYPATDLLLGIAELLGGEPEAELHLAEVAEIAEAAGAHPTAAYALAEVAAAACGRGDWTAADAAIERARRLIDPELPDRYVSTALVCAVGARLALHRGDREQAHDDMIRAQRLRPLLTHVLPWAAVRTRLELIRAMLAMADPVGARTLLREIDDIRGHRPDLGTLGDQVEEIRQQVSGMPPGSVGASALTAAELRLLPYLHTHLTFREIAARLFVSPNTIKTQAISLYRKLGVSSRGEAMARAEELGLLGG
jgi:LuxR family maltose regulon positive regulatory protein